MPYNERILEVYQRISPFIKKTPALSSTYFSGLTEANIIYKCENLQYTNAFKVRGAFNKITGMADKTKTIVTASAGNHGLAIAYATKQFGMKAIVVLPEFVPEFRIKAIQAMGAQVIVHGNTMEDLNAKVAEFTQDPACIYVHGFDDDDIIAGQATIAYELLQDIPDIDIIVSPVGGGGLISGIAQYAKSINPKIEIYGSQTIGADAMSKSLKAGEIVSIPKSNSIAISLSASKVAERTFAIVKDTVNKVVTVSDDEAMRELKLILEKDRLFVEPASATALSAIVSGQIPNIKGKKIAVILSGGNFSLQQLKEYL